MATGKHVAYFRVSTARQGQSGLGLEAQRTAVLAYLDGGRWTLVKEFVEVESGKRADRPQLVKALHLCKVTGARLIVAKLDRLSRNAAFLLSLRDSGVRFVAADMPEATELTVGILAVVAQDEARRISERTIAALAEAKRRGTKLGNPRGAAPLRAWLKKHGHGRRIAAARARADSFARDMAPILADVEEGGVTSNLGVARELNRREIQTSRGAVGRWTDATVARIRRRLQPAPEAA
jgi:DNA invertase Pin-like site-specific DNA recombinase